MVFILVFSIKYVLTSEIKYVLINNYMDNKKEQDEVFEMFDKIWPVGETMQESLPEELKVIEIRRIKLALEQEKNHTHAARSLGIGRTNLLAKLKKYNISKNS